MSVAAPPAFTNADYAAYAAAGAAVLSSIVTFVSSSLSNRNSRKQIERQLEHSANQRDRDRAMTLRRDVYLPAVEAVVRTAGALGQLIDLTADASALGTQLIADFATMAKVHLVASESTVRELLTFQKALTPAWIELLALRASLVARQQSIAVHGSLIDGTLAEKRHLVQLMRQHNLSGSTDQAAMDRLSAQFQNEEINFQTHFAAQATLMQAQAAEHLRIADRCAELSLQVAKTMPEALISARLELELPIDAAEYRGLVVEQQEAVQRTTREWIDRARRQSFPSAHQQGDARPL
jgi:uncharacterized membrane-anchored protein YhcB (DUF1043 family)